LNLPKNKLHKNHRNLKPRVVKIGGVFDLGGKIRAPEKLFPEQPDSGEALKRLEQDIKSIDKN